MKIYEIILKVSKILRKMKKDYDWIFNLLQKWDLISWKFKNFTLNIGKIKNIIKILVNLSIYEVKILILAFLCEITNETVKSERTNNCAEGDNKKMKIFCGASNLIIFTESIFDKVN